MNRSHKHQLEKLKDKNGFTKRDLEIATELLEQNDPPFKEEVQAVIKKIKKQLGKDRER